MAQIDLICRDCKHPFQVVTHTAIKKKQKRCPTCSSDSIRQTLSSYLRNGPLSDPDCGRPRATYG